MTSERQTGMRKKKLRIEETNIPKPRDPNAQAMWGRCRAQTFKDKTKYSRKDKHKGRDF